MKTVNFLLVFDKAGKAFISPYNKIFSVNRAYPLKAKC